LGQQGYASQYSQMITSGTTPWLVYSKLL